MYKQMKSKGANHLAAKRVCARLDQVAGIFFLWDILAKTNKIWYLPTAKITNWARQSDFKPIGV